MVDSSVLPMDRSRLTRLKVLQLYEFRTRLLMAENVSVHHRAVVIMKLSFQQLVETINLLQKYYGVKGYMDWFVRRHPARLQLQSLDWLEGGLGYGVSGEATALSGIERKSNA